MRKNDKYLNYWYKEEEDDLKAECIHDYIERIGDEQQNISLRNLAYLKLYGSIDYQALPLNDFFEGNPNCALNVIQSCVDTVHAKIAKNKPRPVVLTSGGDYKQQVTAEKMDDFINGIFYQSNLYKKSTKVQKSGTILGTGFLKFFKDTEKKTIGCEPVLCEEIKVKYEDGMYGTPSEMHQIKLVSRESLISLFPEKEELIEMAGTCNEYGIYKYNSGEMIKVVETWKLPCKATPKGFWGISIKEGMLDSDEWDLDFFPFAVYRWNERDMGYMGQGLAEQLFDLQLNIARIFDTINTCIRLFVIPKIYVRMDSKINLKHINNEIGSIIMYSGVKPEDGPLARIPQELWYGLDYNWNKSFEVSGVSQMSAQSRNQLGPDASGAAMREMYDIESERFQMQTARFEDFHVDCAKIIIQLAQDMYEKDGIDISVRTGMNKKYKDLKWSDIDLDTDAFYLQIFSSSILPKTPAGRIQKVQELVNSGYISYRMAFKLLDIPDVESAMNLENGPMLSILWNISQIVDDGKYVGPDDLQDLALGIEYFTKAYNLYLTKNLEPKKLNNLRRWISNAKATMDEQEMFRQQQMAKAEQEMMMRNRDLQIAQNAGAVEPMANVNV